MNYVSLVSPAKGMNKDSRVQRVGLKMRGLKVYMTDFFICSIKSPQCADKCSKKVFFHGDFPFPCFDVPKASNFTSGGYKTVRPKTGDWERL